MLSEIIETCRRHEYTDVVLVYEHRGVPNRLVVCHLPFGPTAYFGLYNVVCYIALDIACLPFFFVLLFQF